LVNDLHPPLKGGGEKSDVNVDYPVKPDNDGKKMMFLFVTPAKAGVHFKDLKSNPASGGQAY
jgi:hypothetical protein